MPTSRTIIVALLLTMLLVPVGMVSAQAPDPVEVVKRYIATANTGDFDATFAFYADNAVVRNPMGLFVGKEAIGNWLRQDVQTTRATPKDFQVTGNTVVNTGMVSLARFKAMGIDQVAYRSEYIITNDKIRFFSPTVILTPEQQEQVRANTPASPAPASDPVEVVKNYITTANTGNFEQTFAFYAPGAVVKNPMGLFVGKDEIGTWLRQDVQITRATPRDFQVINGGTTVINTGTVSLARFKAIGIDQVEYRSEYLIDGDKITYFSPTVILTPEQQEKVRAAVPPAAARAALPNTGGTSGPIYWLVALGIAVVWSGLTLIVHRRPS
jgi:ketosteroid isomerase-like protein